MERDGLELSSAERRGALDEGRMLCKTLSSRQRDCVLRAFVTDHVVACLGGTP